MNRETDLTDIPEKARHRDLRLEDFAAELTNAVYPLVLRRGRKNEWLKLELDLWRTLVKSVQKWAQQRPPAASSE